MATITLFDKKGKKSSKSQNIDDKLFGLEANEHLLYLATVRQEANARPGTAHTKTRTEVRGGGAKPWRQKGTGRARAGSIRSPLWRGGGIMHGPRNTVNWTKGMNTKEKARALFSAILLVQKDGRFSAIEEITLEEAKTKELAALVKETGFQGQNVLLVVGSENNQINILKRVSKNLVRTKLISVSELNVKDLLKADQVIATAAAVQEIEERFAPLAQTAAAA